MATITTKYNIGDKVWHATTQATMKHHPCPDCLGTGKWKAVSPAGHEYTFACPRCNTRYMSNHDLSLKYTTFEPTAQQLTIGSIRTNSHTPTYERAVEYMCQETGVGGGSVYGEDVFFDTEESALKEAQRMADAANAGGVDWVKKQYDKSLDISDYQLDDGRDRVIQRHLDNLGYRFRDCLDSIESCETMEEVQEVIKEAREK